MSNYEIRHLRSPARTGRAQLLSTGDTSGVRGRVRSRHHGLAVAGGKARKYSESMSNSELVKQLKALPVQERKKVLKAILELEETGAAVPVKTRRVKWPDIQARAKRIFGERMLPNLVLLERDEETV